MYPETTLAQKLAAYKLNTFYSALLKQPDQTKWKSLIWDAKSNTYYWSLTSVCYDKRGGGGRAVVSRPSQWLQQNGQPITPNVVDLMESQLAKIFVTERGSRRLYRYKVLYGLLYPERGREGNVVHHCNEITLDDRPINLLSCSRSEHSKIHYRLRKQDDRFLPQNYLAK